MRNSLRNLFRQGWFKITLAIILMFGIGWYISDSVGVNFGWLGAFIWIVITIFTATFGIIYFAQFITPTAGDSGWWEGLRLIFTSLSNTPPTSAAAKPKENTRRRQRTQTAVTHINQNQLPPSFKTLKAGILRTHQVIATVYKGKYGGAKGPGFVRLRDKEIVRNGQIIDLRVQRRKNDNVRVTTRDGMQIVTEVSVRFRIKPAEGHPEFVLFPYDKNAIFQVSYADAIDDHGDPIYWQDGLIPQVITFVTQEVSKYTLNELTTLEDGVSNLDEINRIVQQEMERKFDPRGIEILDASMSAPVLTKEIRQQRLHSWQAEWQEKTKQKYADSEIEIIQQRKEVRARAQIKIIDTISRNLNLMQRDDDAEMVGLITLRMIEALEQAVSEGSVRALVPQQIMASLISDSSAQMHNPRPPQFPPAPPALQSPTLPQPSQPQGPLPPQINLPAPDDNEGDE